jgi:hypothetical protein
MSLYTECPTCQGTNRVFRIVEVRRLGKIYEDKYPVKCPNCIRGFVLASHDQILDAADAIREQEAVKGRLLLETDASGRIVQIDSWLHDMLVEDGLISENPLDTEQKPEL